MYLYYALQNVLSTLSYRGYKEYKFYIYIYIYIYIHIFIYLCILIYKNVQVETSFNCNCIIAQDCMSLQEFNLYEMLLMKTC